MAGWGRFTAVGKKRRAKSKPEAKPRLATGGSRFIFELEARMKSVIGEPRSKRQTAEIAGGSLDRNVRTTTRAVAAGARRCRRKFLRFFPRGFADQKYEAWERGYKIAASELWQEQLDRTEFQQLLKNGAFGEVAARAVRIESRTNLLFSFEKMALRDAIRSQEGAERFAIGLFEWLHGRQNRQRRFENWIEAVERLPRRQTRVLTWPLLTVFGFIAEPSREIFLKPMVTTRAAEAYGFPFGYRSRPDWGIYASLLEFAETIRRDNSDLRPKDMIDLQSFIWVQGSEEYD
jgi:hypothetical protein